MQHLLNRLEDVIHRRAHGIAILIFALFSILFVYGAARAVYFGSLYLLSLQQAPTVEVPALSVHHDHSQSTVYWKEVTVKKGDDLIHIFKRQGFSLHTLYQMLALGEKTYALAHLHPGHRLQFLTDDKQQLHGVKYAINLTDTLWIKELSIGRFQAEHIHQAPEHRLLVKSVNIHHSLFVDGNQAGLSNTMLFNLMQIFAWEIDFTRDIRKGDHFRLLYENYFINGKKVRDGHIMAAEFVNRHKQYTAIRFAGKEGHAAYYTAKGLSLQRAFLRTPVKYTRISSRFTWQRNHPILHLLRAHKGVDYAAPRGTPIRASGDGRIVFIGRKGGYGNAIIIQHGRKYSTLYGHMRRFSHGLKRFSHVHQGQIIGYVGMTGLATGPHLHYEFRINGVHHNPLTVKLPKAKSISQAYRAKFLAYASEMMHALKGPHHDG